MPTLIILRHAKAVNDLESADIERRLTDRGRRDAGAAGDRLRVGGLTPDLVLCSPAVRTRETLAGLAFGDGLPVRYEPVIYGNDAGELLDLIRRTDDDVATLVLIGHNPSLHQLVHDLTGDAPDTFPTCAFAVVELDSPWARTGPGAGRRIVTWTPGTPRTG